MFFLYHTQGLHCFIYMRNYRLVLLLKGDLAKEKREKTLKDVEKWAGDVKEVDVKVLGEKRLAYPIKGELRAEYVVMTFGADTVGSELNSRIRMQDDVLRHLLIRD